MRRGGAFATLMVLGAAWVSPSTFDFSGEVSLQGRWYPQSPAFEGQSSSNEGLVAWATLYGTVAQNTSFVLTPLYRFDNADSQRTHGDIRDAYLLSYGEWDQTSWEVRLGLGRVFWGVAELHNLVDIVNQLDLVEHPRSRPKLGQPMVHLTISGDWGIVESFLLPYHRKRTFPGPHGRLRSRFPILDSATYESNSEERNIDFALRYSNSVGLLDVGLSAFVGTSREPSFVADTQTCTLSMGEPSLLPYYEQIKQFGIDAQLTTELLLYKLEAIQRRGLRNLVGREESYRALVLGVEHTVYNLFESSASLTLLGEWLYDERGRRATSVWANDLFVAGFLSFNDVPGTELVVGLLGDLTHNYRALNLEFKRRLSDTWIVRLESIVNLNSDPSDLTYDGRRDSFLGIDLTMSF